MILLTGFYHDPSPVRTEEFMECIRRNSANPHIERITVFLEEQILTSQAQAGFQVMAHPKVQLISHGKRLTFADLFEHANRHLVDARVIIANADIFFR